MGKRNHVVLAMLAILTLGALSGCLYTRRYIKPEDRQREWSDLEIASSDENMSVALNYVILPDGRGAWVKRARWDEYCITARNISDRPLTVERIRLIDPRGLYIESGVKPSQLEKLSRSLERSYKDIGIAFAVGAAPAGGSGAAVAAESIGVGAVAVAAVAAETIVATGVVGVLGLFWPLEAPVTDIENIRLEFNRRRLTTFTLAGNATIQGSVFFPNIPTPGALVVDYRMEATTRVLEVLLDKLKGLHVAPSDGEILRSEIIGEQHDPLAERTDDKDAR